MPNDNPYRLPTTVRPDRYRLTLRPDLESATFAGHAVIDIDVLEAVPFIRFNAIELAIDTITLTDATGATRTGTATFDTTYEWATVTFGGEVPAGTATLDIQYRGELNDRLVGFYRSSYVDQNQVTQLIATSQMQATDARRAFPCWDEPSFKAVFDITLIVPEHLAAYSNSPVVSESRNADGTRTVVYGPTMKMSTYLVAFVVGPFEESETRMVRGTPLRVIAPVGKGHLGAFALDIGEFALNFYCDYFDIPYPGEKLDLVAVPDFAYGAMENVGCVTFRETALLVDPATASLTELERVTQVVAHELAHMWFGDLVTMAWWEGIWLNEAFATLMETICSDAFKPEWKEWLSFVTFREMATEIDGLHSTRPIEYEVIAPAENRGMVDRITYEKGGSVLRMLEQYLGETVFRDGIRLYLKRHSYANTVTRDLWAALGEVSGQPVDEIMDTWILQGGHPLVTYEHGTLTQEPFSYGPPSGPSAIGAHWRVPVATRPLDGGAATWHLLGDEPLTLDAATPTIVNAGGWGFFRLRYGPSELAQITREVSKLNELERTLLIADYWAALFASKIPYSQFRELALSVGDQDEPATWVTLATAYDHLYRAATDDQRAVVQDDVQQVFGPQFARLGFDAIPGESELAAQQRGIVLGVLGTLGDDPMIQAESAARFDEQRFDGDTVRAVLRVTAYQNRPGDYEEFLKRRLAATSPQEEIRYLWGLADFNDEKVALDAVKRCFTEFRGQDAPIVLGQLGRNRVTGPAVFREIMARWDEARQKFPPMVFSRVTMGTVTYFPDRAFADEVVNFFATHTLEGEEKQLAQQLERLRVGLTFTDAVRGQL